jgi:hypothetical protein
MQLCNALSLCRVLNIKHVVLLPDFMFFNRSFVTTDGVEIVREWNEPYDGLTGKFWSFSKEGWAVIRRIPSQEICDTFSFEIHRIFWWDEANASMLYLYIRSGDIWLPGAQRILARQPPCSYYFDAVRFHGGPANAVIIAQNNLNPCVPLLVQAGVTFVRRPLCNDISLLLHSRVVATAISSFIGSLMALSKGPKTVYSFNLIWEKYLPHFVCWETEEYAKAMNPWTVSEAQKLEMKRMIGCHWDWAVPNKSEPSVYLFKLEELYSCATFAIYNGFSVGARFCNSTSRLWSFVMPFSSRSSPA